jgi:hypothetical protein
LDQHDSFAGGGDRHDLNGPPGTSVWRFRCVQSDGPAGTSNEHRLVCGSADPKPSRDAGWPSVSVAGTTTELRTLGGSKHPTEEPFAREVTVEVPSPDAASQELHDEHCRHSHDAPCRNEEKASHADLTGVPIVRGHLKAAASTLPLIPTCRTRVSLPRLAAASLPTCMLGVATHFERAIGARTVHTSHTASHATRTAALSERGNRAAGSGDDGHLGAAVVGEQLFEGGHRGQHREIVLL